MITTTLFKDLPNVVINIKILVTNTWSLFLYNYFDLLIPLWTKMSTKTTTSARWMRLFHFDGFKPKLLTIHSLYGIFHWFLIFETNKSIYFCDDRVWKLIIGITPVPVTIIVVLSYDLWNKD